MPKNVEQREHLLEEVEWAILRGADRPIDILRAVPGLRTHISAVKYMETVQNRWAGRTSENEMNRMRLISEAREVLNVAWKDWKVAPLEARIKLYSTMLKAQERIAKLHGLDVRKVDVSGNMDMLEKREETIALLTASAESHSIRSILQKHRS